ncbi:hypothetical protein GDO86_006729 [Hymenochirus boettgeri]|uniref:Major facilitator superfamily (MFS) profile domain-containing protein n=1 Tax=Hymenochirus boettgeri TaxID=247094 RepID=A0A8T2JES8_9PIPI|nr:hypothetical protein GDO86_006729 [Hymenochirus boettgeri]
MTSRARRRRALQTASALLAFPYNDCLVRLWLQFPYCAITDCVWCFQTLSPATCLGRSAPGPPIDVEGDKPFHNTMLGCSLCQWLKDKRGSPSIVLVVVSGAFLVDCMLFTVVGPIVPAFLYESEFKNRNTSVKFHQSSNSSSDATYDSISNISLFNKSSEVPYQGQIGNRTHPTPPQRNCYTENNYFNDQNTRVGLLLAMKAILQLITNPIVGKIADKVGYDTPLFCGFVVMFISTLMFAFAESYLLLIIARGIQGIGSSFTVVSGMGMVAQVFPDDVERGKAMGISMGSNAFGIVVGPPFGSLMYDYVGKSSPFLVIAAIAALDGALQICFLKPLKFSPVSIPPTPYRKLLVDPYIMIAAVALFLANLTYGMLDTTLPIRMMEHMCAPSYQLGLAFLPCMITFFFSLITLSRITQKLGRWVFIILGTFIEGISTMLMPLAQDIYGLIGPSALLGIGFGFMEITIMPTMALLVDLRHTPNYSGVYAIADIALSLGYAVGPLCGGALARAIGFPWISVIFGIILIVYSPLFILLRNPPGKEENKVRKF